MLAAHYTQNQPVNKSFPGDRLKWVFDQDLDSTAKLVLIVLSSHYNVKREDAFPSIGRIARLSSLGYKAVWKALGRLEAKGLIEANRKIGRVTRWQVHVGPRLVEQEQVDQVDPQEPTPPVTKKRTPKPKWLKQRVKDLTYWRKVYDSGADLYGMPLAYAERIFEDSRQNPVDKPVDKESDLCPRDRGTYVPGTEVPMSQGPTNQKRVLTENIEQKALKSQPRTADSTTTNQSSPLDDPMGLNLVETWETLTGSKMNGHNRPAKVYRPEAFLES